MSKETTTPREATTWASYHKLIHYQQIEWELGHLVGEVLTVLDASIANPEQKKAIKDLVKGCFRRTFDEFQKQASDGKVGNSVKALID